MSFQKRQKIFLSRQASQVKDYLCDISRKKQQPQKKGGRCRTVAVSTISRQKTTKETTCVSLLRDMGL